MSVLDFCPFQGLEIVYVEPRRGLLPMSADKDLEIVGADFINGRELIVEFSDGTSTVYSIEQLLKIRPTMSGRTKSKSQKAGPISS
jgi:hypothetical protein